MREILAEELMRIDDDDTAFVTVTEVEVDNELTRAKVFLMGPDDDTANDYVGAVEAHMGRLRKAISRRANLRHTPRLEFFADPGVQSGARVDEILRTMTDDRAFQEEE